MASCAYSARQHDAAFHAEQLEKLNHPIEDIRQRALHSFLVKLACGVLKIDELAAHRELHIRLIQWFRFPGTAYHREVAEVC